MTPKFEHIENDEIPRLSVPGRLRARLRRTFGKWLYELIEPHRTARELIEYHQTQTLRSGRDRLSASQLAMLTKHQDDTMDVEVRKQYFLTSDHTRTLHGIVLPVLEKILKQDSSIKRTLNIGCNYAYMDFVLSKRFPDVMFQGVDVNPGLVELNADLRSANLRVRPGYALELVESGELQADLVYFSSTATVIRAPELQTYLRLLARNAKYVVFSEPIWRGQYGERVVPTDIPVGGSIPIYMQRHPDTEAIGYLCYAHNFRGLLEQAGFEVFNYRAFRPEFATLDWVVAAGQNRNHALWEPQPATAG